MAQSDRKRRAILDVHDPRFKAPAQCLRRDYCRPAAAVREHSPQRVRLYPTPGTATETDVIRILDEENRPCELVEGTLVEKAMGYEESAIAGFLITYLNNFVLPRKLGIVTGESGAVRLFPGLVRIPDVAFASWDCFPGRKRPKTSVPHLAPDLVVEVLSKSNTKSEMARKLGEYFQAGVRLIWLVNPKTWTARVYTAVDQMVLLKGDKASRRK
jgi:Uma2 family endonuclease